MPLVLAVCLCLNVVLLVALISGEGHGILGMPLDKTIDFASIALLAATLAVIVIGIAVALVTFVGYAEIRRSAIRAAKDAATRVATDVATSVATRVARDTPPADTGTTEADAIAKAVDGE